MTMHRLQNYRVVRVHYVWNANNQTILTPFTIIVFLRGWSCSTLLAPLDDRISRLGFMRHLNPGEIIHKL